MIMLKGLLGFLLFLFFLIILILMLTGGFILKKIREFRKAVQDAADQQAFNYRTETGRKRQQYGSRAKSQFTACFWRLSFRRPGKRNRYAQW